MAGGSHTALMKANKKKKNANEGGDDSGDVELREVEMHMPTAQIQDESKGGEGEVVSIDGLLLPVHRIVFFVICSILTGGVVLPFIAAWSIPFRRRMLFSRCSLHEAEYVHVSVTGSAVMSDGEDIAKVFKLPDLTRYFDFRMERFLWSKDDGSFVRLDFSVDLGTSGGGDVVGHAAATLRAGPNRIRVGELVRCGIDTTVQMQLVNMFGSNEANVPVPPIPVLLFKECMHPFFVFQVLSMTLWYIDDYIYYSSVIVFLAFCSLTLNVYETRQSLFRVRDLARTVPIKIECLRNAEWSTIESDRLVPGDVVKIPEHEPLVLPCDMLLLRGTCVVDEAMLTGESVPVAKYGALDSETAESKSTLFCGTKSIRALHLEGSNHVLAVVTKTGFLTAKGHLVRSILFPKGARHDLAKESFKFVGMLLCVALCGSGFTAFTMHRAGAEEHAIVIKTLDIITIAIPPALPIALTIGSLCAMARLKKLRIFCTSPGRIDVAGQVDTVCLDKTGTLTTNGLRVIAYVEVTQDGGEGDGEDKQQQQQEEQGDTEVSSAPTTVEMNGHGKAVVSSSARWKESIDAVSPFAVELEEDSDGEDEDEDADDDDNDRSLASTISAGSEDLEAGHPRPGQKLVQPTTTTTDKANGKKKETGGEGGGAKTGTNPPPQELLYAMASCHELVAVPGGNLAGDPLDMTLYEASKAKMVVKSGEEWCVLPSGYGEMTIIARHGFDPAIRRMSVVVQWGGVGGASGAGRVSIYCKGAPESVRSVCNPETVPADLDEKNHSFACHGSRVIALAVRHSPADPKAQRDEIECKMTFLGLVVLENPLKHDTPSAIAALNRARIKCAIITGDAAMTGIHVGRETAILSPDATLFLGEPTGRPPVAGELTPGVKWTRVDESGNLHPADPPSFFSGSTETSSDSLLVSDGGSGRQSALGGRKASRARNVVTTQLALTGTAFELLKNHSTVDLAMVAEKTGVFARATPEQKALIVSTFQARHVVCFCGDGANDVTALKAADVGLSLSEAEASIAAPFTSAFDSVHSVVTLLREGRCSLVTSFQCFKFIALYSLLQFFQVAYLHWFGFDLGDFQFLYIDLVLILPLSFLMSLTEPARTLRIQRPPSRLVSISVISSLVGQICICFGSILIMTRIQHSQSWYFEPDFDADLKTNSSSLDNNTVFLFGNFCYLWLCIGLSTDKPFRRPFYRNKYFTGAAICLFIFNTIMVFTSGSDPSSGFMDFFSIISGQPLSYRFGYFFASIGFGFVAWFFERLVPIRLAKMESA